jgi:hypothetical protein
MLSKASMGLVLAAALLASTVACDNAEKRAKECAARCIAEAETCQKRHEANCEARGRTCGQACERNVTK